MENGAGPPALQPPPPLHINYRFYNTSDRLVDVVWLNPDGSTRRYGQLKRRTYMNIATFDGHRWVFMDAQDGEVYLSYPGGLKEFTARRAAANIQPQIVLIRPDDTEISLRRLALRKIASLSHPESVEYLICLPVMLRIELAQYYLQCLDYSMRYDIAGAGHQEIYARLRAFIERSRR